MKRYAFYGCHVCSGKVLIDRQLCFKLRVCACTPIRAYIYMYIYIYRLYIYMYIQTCPPFPSYPRDPCLEPYEEESSDLLLLGCVYATISAANFPPEFPRRKLSKWTCNSCYRHSWWKLARVTPLYNVQRARTTYACYERQLLIVARPSLALHRVLPPLPLLHYFFFFFPSLSRSIRPVSLIPLLQHVLPISDTFLSYAILVPRIGDLNRYETAWDKEREIEERNLSKV